MGKELVEKRKLEFEQYIIKNGKLPKVWEEKFTDGEDLRLWYNSVLDLPMFSEYLKKIHAILLKSNQEVLSPKEKKEAFLKFVLENKRLPFHNEIAFTDSEDMETWYHRYILINRNFEDIVHENLLEYQSFDLGEVWTFVKDEFISNLNKLKRIPKHGEVKMTNGIDMRIIYDKLASYDPHLVEKILLHLTTFDENRLTIDQRKEELIAATEVLGYIPTFQEVRFSDKTDMFTWYLRYKKVLPGLEKELRRLACKRSPKVKGINLYLIPDFKKTGGDFYFVCANEGEKLDLTNIDTYEKLQALDSTVTKKGSIILKRDEKINSVDFKRGV